MSNDGYISIECDNYQFLRILRGMLGLKTTLSYHVPDINEKGILNIPVDMLTNFTGNLYKSKVREVKQFIRSFDYKVLPIDIKREISYMKSIPKFIRVDSEDIPIRNPFENGIERVELIRKNGVIQLITPYEKEAMVIFDYSRPFSDMAFSYNSLHFFEHIMCSPWVDIKGKSGLITMNGFTTDTGLCYIYSIVNDSKTLQKYYNAEVEFIEYVRKNGVPENVMRRESARTISETKNEPYLICFARNTGRCFDGEYSSKIIEYWINKPIKCLVISPWRIETTKLSKTFPIRKPVTPKFLSLPREVVIGKAELMRYSVKSSMSKNVSILLSMLSGKCELGKPFTMGYDIIFYYLNDIQFHTFVPLFLLITASEMLNDKNYMNLFYNLVSKMRIRSFLYEISVEDIIYHGQ